MDGNLSPGRSVWEPYRSPLGRVRMGVSWLPSLTDRRVPLRELGMKSEDPALLGCDLGRIFSHCETQPPPP